jgi:ABC-type branched-subunit amino acid transport system ATPase component
MSLTRSLGLKMGPGTVKYGTISILGVSEFEMVPESISLIRGSNGTGKTSLLRAIMGAGASFDGDVFLDNSRINEFPCHLRSSLGLAYLPQERKVFDRLSVTQHLVLAVEASKKGSVSANKKQIPPAARLILEMLGGAQKRGQQLSGGQAKLLLIASISIRRPRFLLLDEPYAGLDPHGQSILEQMIFDCIQDGGACALSDHTSSAMAALPILALYDLIQRSNEIDTSLPGHHLVRSQIQ